MNKLALGVLLALVCVTLVGGFMVVGGPGYAQLEKQDQARLMHLQALGQYHACQPDGLLFDEWLCRKQEELPTPPEGIAAADYIFTRASDIQFEVCVPLKTSTVRSPNYQRFLVIKGQTACLTYVEKIAGRPWELK